MFLIHKPTHFAFIKIKKNRHVSKKKKKKKKRTLWDEGFKFNF